MKRDSVEINHDAPQWSHHAVWNRKYMEPKPGYTLEQLWADSEPAISKKTRGWIRATTFEGTLQGGLEGSLPGGGGARR